MTYATWHREIHERLLARDPTAPAELAEAILPALVSKLQKGNRASDDLIIEAASDALMSYFKAPEKFDPEKRSLFGYLAMAATGDLLNALDKQRRIRCREVGLEDVSVVEMREASRNMEDTERRAAARVDGRRMVQQMADLFPDPIDRELLRLVLNEERRTEPYARLLGLEGSPIDVQRREVKRHKDRVKKRLERHGQETRG